VYELGNLNVKRVDKEPVEMSGALIKKKKILLVEESNIWRLVSLTLLL
jgi:hypothetical protein